MTGPGWQGRLSVRPGIVAFTGSIGSASLHAHAAMQVYWCDRGRIEVADDTGETVTASSAVIPAGARHTVSAEAGTTGTTVFLDPSSRWAPEGGSWTTTPAAWADEARSGLARDLALEAFGSGRDQEGSFGDRVEAWVRSRLPAPVLVPELADSLAVSQATLRRRARGELGLGVGTYVRWVRLIVALEQVGAGASITDAATAAGFADGSHATRACREMFGLSPSEAIARLTIEQT